MILCPKFVPSSSEDLDDLAAELQKMSFDGGDLAAEMKEMSLKTTELGQLVLANNVRLVSSLDLH
jgi:hypothetical protein